MKNVLVILFVIVGIGSGTQAKPVERKTAGNVIAVRCSVEFKQRQRMIWTQSQDVNSTLLASGKGTAELKSMGDVKISLFKNNKNDPKFVVSVKQKGELLGEGAAFSGMTLLLPIDVHIEDGEDGVTYEEVRISCQNVPLAG